MKKSLLVLFYLFFTISLFAQPALRIVDVSVTPNSKDWNYKLGEKVKFEIRVTQNGVPISNVDVRYELSNDMMEPFKKETLKLKDGTMEIDGGTMKEPGFLRCRVFVTHNGNEYEGRGTGGFEPEKLKPTTKLPADFLEFWKKAIAENAKIPMDSKITLLPEKCTDKVNVYEVSIQNYQIGSRLYGILSVPKAPGKYPALLRVPGAGVRPYNGDVKNAEKGFVTFEIGINGIPVTLPPYVYDNLRYGGLNSYQTNNWDDRDKVYYKRVYLGCVRAVDYIFSLPEFDGGNILVYGGSQGGTLSVVTAALDSRVKGSIVFYPALTDLTGYLSGRAGGWPHLFRANTDKKCILDEKVKNSQYYDAANFATLLKAPVFYAFGYNDMVCPPTTSYAMYNIITAPKQLLVMPKIEHYTFPEMWDEAWKWAYPILGVK